MGKLQKLFFSMIRLEQQKQKTNQGGVFESLRLARFHSQAHVCPNDKCLAIEEGQQLKHNKINEIFMQNVLFFIK